MAVFYYRIRSGALFWDFENLFRGLARTRFLVVVVVRVRCYFFSLR